MDRNREGNEGRQLFTEKIKFSRSLRKTLSLLVVVTMILTSFDISGVITAYAATQTGVSINGLAAETGVDNKEVMPDTLQPGQVWTGKTVQDKGNGSFDITLSALGRGYKTTEQTITSKQFDVVFVLDYSDSMNMGANGTEPGRPGYDSRDTRKIRMEKAANDAISRLLANNTQDLYNRVAVVKFDKGVSILKGWTSSLAEGEYISSTANYGTNLQAGINQGHLLLQKRNRDAAKPIMIVLSDGVPERYYTDIENYPIHMNASQDTEHPWDNDLFWKELTISGSYYSIKQANLVKSNNPGLTIYTVGFGLNDQDREYGQLTLNPTPEGLESLLAETFPDAVGLSNYSDHFYKGSINDLDDIFNNIVETITKHSQVVNTVTITDTLGEGFELTQDQISSLPKGVTYKGPSGDNKNATITWTLSGGELTALDADTESTAGATPKSVTFTVSPKTTIGASSTKYETNAAATAVFDPIRGNNNKDFNPYYWALEDNTLQGKNGVGEDGYVAQTLSNKGWLQLTAGSISVSKAVEGQIEAKENTEFYFKVKTPGGGFLKDPATGQDKIYSVKETAPTTVTGLNPNDIYTVVEVTKDGEENITEYSVVYEQGGRVQPQRVSSEDAVVTNQDSMTKITNTAKTASVTFQKKDNNGVSLADATFTLTRNQDENYSTLYETKTQTSNAQGAVTFENVPYGTYTLTETTSPTGYQKAGTTWTVEVGEGGVTFQAQNSADKDNNLTVVNIQDDTSIRIVKNDKENQTLPLPGAKFKIKTGAAAFLAKGQTQGSWNYSAAEGNAEEFITGQDGTVTISGLKYGTYTIIETTAPGQYRLPAAPDNAKEVVLSPESSDTKNKTVTFSDEKQKGSIQVEKQLTDSQGNQIQGQDGNKTFYVGLFKEDGSLALGSATESVKEITLTGGTGSVEFANLPLGDYEVWETDNAGAKVTASFPYQVITTVGEQATNSVTLDTDLQSVQVLIKNQEKNDGKITVTKTVDNDSVEITNHPSFKVGLFTGASQDTTTTVKEITWDEDTNSYPTVTFDNLAYGNYYIYEVDQDGKKVSETDFGYEVTGDGAVQALTFDNHEASVSITNTLKTNRASEFSFIKTDNYNNPLQGVEFTLTPVTLLSGGSMEPVKVESNAVGKVTFTGLPYGRYTLEETKALSGYSGAGNRWTVTIGSTNKVELNDVDVTTGFKVENAQENTSVDVVKKEKNTDILLSGAVFVVKVDGEGEAYVGRADGSTAYNYNSSKENALRFTTDADGKVVIPNLKYGSYKLEEIQAPTGYQLESGNTTVFVVAPDKKIQTLTIENSKSKTYTFSFKKVGDDAPNGLSGMTFHLYTDAMATGQPSGSAVSAGDGTVTFSNLTFGEYYFKEADNSESGYTVDGKLYRAVIAEDGSYELFAPNAAGMGYDKVDNNAFQVSNTRKTGSLTVNKVDQDGAPLSGAQFKLYSAKDGNTLSGEIAPTQSDNTAAATSFTFEGLKSLTTYYLQETTVPEGYAAAKEGNSDVNKIYTVTVDKDGAVRVAGLTTEAVAAQTVTIANWRSGRREYTLEKQWEDFNNKYQARRDLKVVIERKQKGSLESKWEQYGNEITLTAGDAVSDQSNIWRMSVGNLPAYTDDGKYEYEYRARETNVPAGYHEDKTSARDAFTLVNKLNTQDITLSKQDNYENPLGGVEFTLTRVGSEGDTVTFSPLSENTGEDGSVTFQDIPYGTYTLSENGLAGYQQDVYNKKTWKVEVDSSGFRVYDGQNQQITGPVIVNEQSQQITVPVIVNEQDGTVLTITKTDGETGEKLAGAEFVLKLGDIYVAKAADGSFTYQAAGEDQAAVFTTPDGSGGTTKGVLEITGLKFGDYTIIEKTSPTGYGKAANQNVTLGAGNVTVAVTVENSNTQDKGFSLKKVGEAHDPLPGATFTLYGSLEDATGNKNTLKTGQSNADGLVEFTGLKHGDYYMKETTPPTGFEENSSIYLVNIYPDKTFKISAPTDEGGRYEAVQPINGVVEIVNRNSWTKSFSFMKTDESGAAVALDGAKFALYTDENATVPATDKNGKNIEAISGENAENVKGKVVFGGLRHGTYYFKEVEGLPGYQKDDHIYRVEIQPSDSNFVISARDDRDIWEPVNDSAAFSVVNTNTATKSFRFKKSEENGGAPIQGAEFTLYHDPEAGQKVLDTVGRPVTGISNAAGVVEFSNLRHGTYYFKESKLAGYDENAQIYKVDVLPDSTQGFDIYTNNAQTGAEPNWVKVEELTVTNKRSADKSFRFSKIDEAGAGLNGAEFTLYGNEAMVAENIIATATSKTVEDQNGIVEFSNLGFGTYYFKETKGIPGYGQSGKEYEVTLPAGSAGNVTFRQRDGENAPWQSAPEALTVVNKNDASKSFQFNKVDENEEPVGGAPFGLYTEPDDNKPYSPEGSQITATSGADGIVRFGSLRHGTYYFKELKSDSFKGYEQSEEFFKVDISNTGEATISRRDAASGEWTPVAAADLPLKVKNTNTADKGFHFIKTDEINAGIQGAVFTLYLDEACGNAAQKDGKDHSATSDVDGKVTFTGLKHRDYFMKETTVPTGYAAESPGKVYKVQVKPDGSFEILENDGQWKEIGKLGGEYQIKNTNVANKSIILNKIDDGAAAVKGATFRLTSEDGEVTQDATSDEDGKVEFTSLKHGTYFLVEISAPDAYVADTTTRYKVELSASSTDGNQYKLYKEEKESTDAGETSRWVELTEHKISNARAASKSFTFKKVDEKGASLDQATFGLFSGASDSEAVVKNGSQVVAESNNGVVSFSDLTIGTYYVKETKAPAGYIPYEDFFRVTVRAEGDPLFESRATPEGSWQPYTGSEPFKVANTNSSDKGFYFDKVDADKENTGSKRGLADAEFGVYKSYADGTLSDQVIDTNGLPVFTSDESGRVYVSNLPHGDYYFQETKAPTGYQLDGTVYKVVISPDKSFKIYRPDTEEAGGWSKTPAGSNEEGSVFQLDNENTADKSFFFTKVEDDGADTPLAGAQFTLYSGYADGALSGLVKTSNISGADGKITFSGLKHGDYYFKETTNPVGYDKDETVYKVTVQADKTTFTIYRPDATAEDGWVEAGSNVEGNEFKFANENSNSKGFSFMKVAESAEGKALNGATFALYRSYDKENDAVSDPVTVTENSQTPLQAVSGESGTEGKVEFKDLQHGTYYFKEISSPTGYLLDDATYRVILEANSDFTIYRSDETPEGWRQVGSNTELYKLVNTNAPTKSFTFMKKADTLETIDGARFGLYRSYDKDKNEVSDPVTVKNSEDPQVETPLQAVSGENGTNGKVEFKDLPHGTYYFREEEKVPGYDLDTSVYRVDIAENNTAAFYKLDGTKSWVRAEEEPFTVINYNSDEKSFTFKKVADVAGSVTKEPLAGASFGLYHDEALQVPVLKKGEDGREIPQTAVSKNDGEVRFDKLKHGTYYLKELESDAIKGYGLDPMVYQVVISKDNSFVVNKKSESGTEWTFFADNTVDHAFVVSNTNTATKGFEFTKTDGKDLPLGGAQFGLYYDEAAKDPLVVSNSNQVTAVSQGDNGRVIFTNLKHGTYYFKEMNQLDGYAKSDKIYRVKLLADGTATFQEKTEAGWTELGDTLTVVNTNTPDKGFSFIKVDGVGSLQTAAALDGAEFTLYSDSGATQELKDTQNNTVKHVSGQPGKNGEPAVQGKVIFSGLEHGTYYMKETGAPAGYKIGDRIYEVVILADGSATIEGENATGYRIGNDKSQDYGFSFRKVDAKHDPLPGSIFALYKDRTLNDQVAECDDTTSASGEISFEDLAFGTYYLKETQAPVGYKENNKIYSVKIESDGTVTIDGTKSEEFQVVNTKAAIYTFEFQKTGGGQPLEGAKFRLVNSEDGIDQKAASGEDGKVHFENLVAGNYTLTEESAPENYIKDANSYTVVIADDGAVKVEDNGTEYSSDNFIIDNAKDVNDIIVSKNVIGLQDSSDIFDFEITLDGYDSVTYTKTNADGTKDEGNTLTAEGGVFTISLVDKESIRITGIEIGTAYSVKEVTQGENYSTLVNGQEGNELQGEIPAKRFGAGLVQFANVRKGDLVIGKTTVTSFADNDINKRAASNTDNEFAFRVKFSKYMDSDATPSDDVDKGTPSTATPNDSEEGMRDPNFKDWMDNLFNKNGSMYDYKGDYTVYDTVTSAAPAKKTASNGLIRIKGGQYAIIEDQPYGTFYSVQEDENYMGDYKLTHVYGTINGSGEGTIIATDSNATRATGISVEPERVGLDALNLASFTNTWKYSTVRTSYYSSGIGSTSDQAQWKSEGSIPETSFEYDKDKLEDAEKKIEKHLEDEHKHDNITHTYSLKEVVIHKKTAAGVEPPVVIQASTAGDITTHLSEDAVYKIEVKYLRENGAVELTKYGVIEGSEVPLQGAEFRIYKYSSDKLVAEKVTDANGKLYLDDIAPGKYYLKETKAPAGYQLDNRSIEFEVTAGSVTDLGSVYNQTKTGSVLLSKENSDHKALPGAEFELYKTQNGTDTFITRARTNGDGQIIVNDLELGDYYFKEVSAPTGYLINPDRVEFSIRFEDVQGEGAYRAEVSVVDEYAATGVVELTKTDSENADRYLAGAEFDLYGTGGKITSGVTDGNGKITISDLAIGSYYFVETKAPTGYVLDGRTIPFTITADDIIRNTVVKVGAANTFQKGSVNLVKTNKDGSKLLQGAEFSLYRLDGTVVASKLTTDENGMLKLTNLPIGDYYFLETKAPTGYDLPTGTEARINFTITYDNTITLTVTNTLTDGGRNDGGNGGGNGGGDNGGPHGSGGDTGGGPGEETTIPDDLVPLANLPAAGSSSDGSTIINDGLVPLAALPKTGDGPLKGVMTFFAGLMLGLVALLSRKKKEEGQ